ncbi:MAG TPA: hypothetical protein VKR59_04625 [Terriglobales bacterium]|nr:hypothetical protein [Terriglobales bacterium]
MKRRPKYAGTRLKNGADLPSCYEILERNLKAAKNAVKALAPLVANNPQAEKELPWLMLNYRVQNSIDVIEDFKQLLVEIGEME